MNKQKLQSGSMHLFIVVILVVALMGALGFVYWQNFMQKKDTVVVTDNTSTETEKETTMRTWLQFSEPITGLNFSYPPEWGEPASDELIGNVSEEIQNTKYYIIRFSIRKNVAIRITPMVSLRPFDETFLKAKQSLVDFPDSRHAFINTDTLVGEIYPSVGNQTSNMLAARLMDIPRIGADDLIIGDYKDFGDSCTEAAYVSCFTTDELKAYQWLLESAEAQP